MTTDNLRPARMHHPGRILKREMDARHMTAAQLAYELELQASYIADVVDGKADIAPSFSIKLGFLWGMYAYFWWDLQCDYERWQEEQHGR